MLQNRLRRPAGAVFAVLVAAGALLAPAAAQDARSGAGGGASGSDRSVLPRLALHEIPTPRGAHQRGSVLVRIRVRQEDPEFQRVVRALGAEVVWSSRLVPGLVQLSFREDAPRVVGVLRKLSGLVEFANFDYAVQTQDIPNDPAYGQLWGMESIGAPQIWENWQGDEEFVIAVIDSGVDVTHPDLTANIWKNTAELNGMPGVDDDGNGYIDDVNGWDFTTESVSSPGDPDVTNGSAHGTHCAGTIGAVGDNGTGVAGVNWRIKIMPLKFIEGRTGWTSHAIKCIEYALDKGVRLSSNSWGGDLDDPALLAVLERAREEGHLFVAAAGNNGSGTPDFPARYDLDNIISVAAVDSDDVLADFSQWNPVSVDLAAPGVNIYSTYYPNHGYSAQNGTSMATPHVAGAAALIWSRNPTWTYEQVRDAILDNVRPVPGLGEYVATGGVLDLAAAFQESDVLPTLTLDAPAYVDPEATLDVRLTIEPGSDIVQEVRLHHRLRGQGGAYASVPMTSGDGLLYTAAVGPFACGQVVEYAVEVRFLSAGAVYAESAGTSNPLTAYVGTPGSFVADGFETAASDAAWTIGAPGDTAVRGIWQRASPSYTIAQPGAAAEGAICFVTDGRALPGDDGAYDVDGGRTTLVSPSYDLSAFHDAEVSYARWFSNHLGGAPGTDVFTVEIRSAATGWTLVETVGPDTPESRGGWFHHSFLVSDFVTPGPGVQVRFVAADTGLASLVEAAVDDFRIASVDCGSSDCLADRDDDGAVGVMDLIDFLSAFGGQHPSADLDKDGQVGVADLIAFLGAFSAGC